LSATCAPEKTCGGSTGEPATGGVYSDYFINRDVATTTTYMKASYTFDSAGCYFNHVTSPPVKLYSLVALTNPTASKTRAYKMIRIRRLWQFPSYSPTSPLPSDVYNREVQVIYESSDDNIKTTNYGWMMGDMVPLNSCAYVVS
jgi:hypothetical protein